MKITVLGLGHLGTVAAGGLATAGHDVTGLDNDHRKIEELNSGRVSIYEPGLQECLASCVDRGNLRFSRSDEFSGPIGQIALIAAGPPDSVRRCRLGQVRSVLACLWRAPFHRVPVWALSIRSSGEQMHATYRIPNSLARERP